MNIDSIYQRQLKEYLDGLTITSENIGDIRRSLFVPYDGIWNSVVRDETAVRENKRPGIYVKGENE